VKDQSTATKAFANIVYCVYSVFRVYRVCTTRIGRRVSRSLSLAALLGG